MKWQWNLPNTGPHLFLALGATIIFSVDYHVPLGIAMAVPYVTIVLLASTTRAVFSHYVGDRLHHTHPTRLLLIPNGQRNLVCRVESRHHHLRHLGVSVHSYLYQPTSARLIGGRRFRWCPKGDVK